MSRQLNLFKLQTNTTGWRLPDLTGWLPARGPLAVDTETTGLEPFEGDRVVGVSVATAERGYYLPFGHPEGPQFEPLHVHDWLRAVLAGRDLYFANAKFDVHMLRTFGLDLEALGCRVHDVQFHAALLNERRRRFALDDLGQEFLGEGKLKLPEGRIHDMPSDVVGPYAEQDAWLTFRLGELFKARLQAENLMGVADLEDSLVYATCEMERNGAPLDLDKLERWRNECLAAYQREFLRLSDLAGKRINPTSTPQVYSLLCLRGIEHPTPASVTMEDLRRYEKDPAIACAINARRYASLLSKYLDKYLAAAGRTGILRFSLNQLRSDEFGTVTGRFSSSDVNIQQVFATQEGVAADYPIRELFVPRQGQWLCADASQIEFRLFGHYANDRHVTAVYRLDPQTDFHQMVADLTGLTRGHAKHINFGKLYGMGLEKMKSQMRLRYRGADPPTDSAIERMFYQYDRKFPAVRTLAKKAATLAEQRGYVRTLIGRCRRYSPGDKTHTAINAVIQGTAADVMKLKLLHLYQERKNLGLTMRLTVHDEVDGDIEPDKVDKIREVLDTPTLDVRVPILWTVKTGANWKDAH